MKKLFVALLLAIAFALSTVGSPAWAGDAAAGAAIFGANCAACHMGGGNTVNPAKTLSQKDLDTNGKNSEEAVISQVNNGAGAMPPFKGRLTDEQIANVAAYVIGQSEAGWPK